MALEERKEVKEKALERRKNLIPAKLHD